MVWRYFRQFGLADSIVRRRGKKSEWLDRLDAALDWPALETIVEGIDASREVGLAYPLLTYVKLLLLQQWYGRPMRGWRRRSTTGSPSAASPASRCPRACRTTARSGASASSWRGAAWPRDCSPRSTGSSTREA